MPPRLTYSTNPMPQLAADPINKELAIAYAAAMSRFHRLLFVAVLLAGASPSRAQLVTFTSRGYLEFGAETVSAPDFVPGEIVVSFALLLSRPPEPAGPEASIAIYRPERTRLLLAGREFAVAEAEFRIVRLTEGPFAPASGYLLTGITDSGWRFTLDHSSPSLEFAPSFALPRALPTELDWSHAVTLESLAGRWAVYGDAVIESVRLSPVPEPALFGTLAGAILLGCLGRRQWSRRVVPVSGPAVDPHRARR